MNGFEVESEAAPLVKTELFGKARAPKHRNPPEAQELFDAFCAKDARDLAFKLSAPRASQLWADASRRDEVLSVAGQVPGLVGRVLARADSAWARQFRVFGKDVLFGRGQNTIDWHRDHLSGGRFDPKTDGMAVGLVGDATLDPRACYAVSRFEQAVALGQGVWLSPSEEDRARFAHEFSLQVKHFAAQNPPFVGVNWSCPMEAALRAMNLSLGFLMMRHRPELQDGEFALTFASLLASHGRFIEAVLEREVEKPNTHHVANLVGLLHLGVIFPELPGARGWRDLATNGLRKEIERQVLDDGFTFEGSTSYHRTATELFTLGLFIAHAGRIRLGDEYTRKLHDMYRAVRVYLSPAGTAPQIGDNDSGRAMALCDRGPLEHGYLLPLGAALYLDPELRTEGMDYCDEALFLMGPAGLERFGRVAESLPPRSAALNRAGLFFIRSRGDYCAISCGPNGQNGAGGHSHNDKLAVEIYARETPVIVDTGTYCFASDPVQRNAFRATAAHSTVQVDLIEQNRLPEDRLFTLPDDARAKLLSFESTPLRDRFAGEHRGYERLLTPVRHRRDVTYERQVRAFVIVDRLTGVGKHELASRFQLPDAEARLRAPTEAEKAKLARLPNAAALDLSRIVELGPASAPHALLATSAGELLLRPSWYSAGYGQRVSSLYVEHKLCAEMPAELSAAVLLLKN